MTAPAPAPIDQHYTVTEVAKLLHLSESVVRGCFAGLPGVLTITRPRLVGKREYTSIRIPASVLRAWHERHSGGGVGEVQHVGGLIQQSLVLGDKRRVVPLSRAQRGVAK
jgi:hypothetical protein